MSTKFAAHEFPRPHWRSRRARFLATLVLAAGFTVPVLASTTPHDPPLGTRALQLVDGPIAFASNRESASGKDHDIVSANADGTGYRRLTSSPNDDREPTWSPDGRQLAYTSYEIPALVIRSSREVA